MTNIKAQTYQADLDGNREPVAGSTLSDVEISKALETINANNLRADAAEVVDSIVSDLEAINAEYSEVHTAVTERLAELDKLIEMSKKPRRYVVTVKVYDAATRKNTRFVTEEFLSSDKTDPVADVFRKAQEHMKGGVQNTRALLGEKRTLHAKLIRATRRWAERKEAHRSKLNDYSREAEGALRQGEGG